jgi:flagellar basal body P-ring formation protein FlgA
MAIPFPGKGRNLTKIAKFSELGYNDFESSATGNSSMSLRWLIGLSVTAILIGFGGPSWASGFEAPQAIRAAIRVAARADIATAAGARLEVDVGAIDPRIHLPGCDALEVTIPRIAAPALTARVRCPQPAWTLYVPIELHDWGRVVVAATNLAPDATLTAADLMIARVDLMASGAAYLTDPAAAEGKVLRANVRAGAPIPAALLEQPVIVHRGQSVVLTLTDGAITIRTSVVALQDGRAGQSILVQNPESRKNVWATVSSAGGVELNFGQQAAAN